MSFKNRVKRAMSRGSSSINSPTESSFPSQEISRIQTPTSPGSGSGSFVDYDRLTIDPRENPLTLIESNATAKRKSTLSRLRSVIKKEDPFLNWPSDVYKPHEMPRPKYRRPVDPEHKATLQSYSLRDAFANMRRRSGLSEYSPYGSRLSSRRNSFSSRARISAFSSRNHSVAALTMEDEDEDLSVPLSRQHTENPSTFLSARSRRRGDTITDDMPVPELVSSSSMDSDDTTSSLYTSQPASLDDVSQTIVPPFEKPFDEEELNRALSRKLALPEC